MYHTSTLQSTDSMYHTSTIQSTDSMYHTSTLQSTDSMYHTSTMLDMSTRLLYLRWASTANLSSSH